MNQTHSSLSDGQGSARFIGGASMGCSSVTSVFAFLVFLFALLDFLMGMNKRKRRNASAQDAGYPCSPTLEHSTDPVAREVTLASALLWRGRLLSSPPDECSASTTCQAAKSAASLGRWVQSFQFGQVCEATLVWTGGFSHFDLDRWAEEEIPKTCQISKNYLQITYMFTLSNMMATPLI